MQDARIKTILNYCGKAYQRIKLVEEVGEMLAEVGRYVADGERRTNKADIVSELADVVIVIRQLYLEASKVEQKVPEDGDVARQLCEKAALIDLFVRDLAEVPMLQMAIEQKIDRQMSRILSEVF